MAARMQATEEQAGTRRDPAVPISGASARCLSPSDRLASDDWIGDVRRDGAVAKATIDSVAVGFPLGGEHASRRQPMSPIRTGASQGSRSRPTGRPS